MIKLDIRPYCNDCLDFEPDVERPNTMHSDYELYICGDTVVRCENRDKCERIRKHLEDVKHEASD